MKKAVPVSTVINASSHMEDMNYAIWLGIPSTRPNYAELFIQLDSVHMVLVVTSYIMLMRLAAKVLCHHLHMVVIHLMQTVGQ
ncbi:hypothetical protein O3M35_000940 [Rhynocoris fuscipes]|uniref:Uncharacterized protein n=1 Tax=Rhynocoris fuscipes TaxID=488301 RepID=A0AAW1DNI9_9HEMI